MEEDICMVLFFVSKGRGIIVGILKEKGGIMGIRRVIRSGIRYFEIF